MKATILAIGTEVVTGDITNTNAVFIAKELNKYGIQPYCHIAVHDTKKQILNALDSSFEKTDLIITTGGLGPTYDDITKKTIAKYFEKKLVFNHQCFQKLKEYFEKSGKIMTENNESQCYFPKDSIIIPNNNGTAPGAIITEGKKTVIMLPGPPCENKLMLVSDVVSEYLKSKSKYFIKEVILRFFGIGESLVQEKLKDILKCDKNLIIAPYIKTGEVELKITSRALNENECDKLISKAKKEILAVIGEYLYSENNEEIEVVLLKLLKEKEKQLISVESCTGGLIGEKITSVPGSSENYLGGLITYSNEMKVKLCNVKEETLKMFGAVSKGTAGEMAEGALKYCNADIAISVTGLAGPGGATDEKPVGLVYIGMAVKDKTEVKRFSFMGDREKIREQSAKNAMFMAIQELRKQ